MDNQRLMISKVEEHEELKAIDFVHRRWKIDEDTKLKPLVVEARTVADGLEKRYIAMMSDLDKFLKKAQLVPKEADFLYYIEDGVIFAAPRIDCERALMIRTF